MTRDREGGGMAEAGNGNPARTLGLYRWMGLPHPSRPSSSGFSTFHGNLGIGERG